MSPTSLLLDLKTFMMASKSPLFHSPPKFNGLEERLVENVKRQLLIPQGCKFGCAIKKISLTSKPKVDPTEVYLVAYYLSQTWNPKLRRSNAIIGQNLTPNALEGFGKDSLQNQHQNLWITIILWEVLVKNE
ncbi:hypothetical protein ACTXT7_013397 [Hymenolepis weldensis]